MREEHHRLLQRWMERHLEIINESTFAVGWSNRRKELIMTLKIKSEVVVDGIGKMRHEHTQEFADDSNVFGRVLEYHQYMYNTFPKCEFRLISAEIS